MTRPVRAVSYHQGSKWEKGKGVRRMQLKKMELLAPAGEWDAFVAAVRAGADAIYIGGRLFGARQQAVNFDTAEMCAAVKLAHMFRVKVYVTVNTLVDDTEFDALRDYLVELEAADVDAILVQDVGVLRFVRKHFPDMVIHISTQMSVASAAAVRWLAEQYGVERVVLARECTLAEIKEITSLGVDIEVFAHGALCISYSGQCLMSSMIGGRSGNRGRCAQPCRLPYTLVDKKGAPLLEEQDAGQYLLSPRDLKTVELLPEWQKAGVSSLKIEGRMKRPEYVAIVVDVYRRALDRLATGGDFYVLEADLANLRQIFNRDFTTAYLQGDKPGRNMMSDRRPNNRGRLIGRVFAVNPAKRQVSIRLEAELADGDGIEFWVKVGGRTGVTANNLIVEDKIVSIAYPGQIVSLFANDLAGIKVHDRVFCTLDKRLMDRARSLFSDEADTWRIPVSAQVIGKLGAPLIVSFSDDEGNTGVAQTDFIVEKARSQPLSKERVRQQLERLGQTYFRLISTDIQLEAGIMAPISEINEARRKAIQQLEENRLQAFNDQREKTTPVAIQSVTEDRRPVGRAVKTDLQVQVDTVEKAEIACRYGADSVVFGGDHYSRLPVTEEILVSVASIAKHYGIPVWLATPRVISQSLEETTTQEMKIAEQSGFDGVYLSGMSALALAKENISIPLAADWTFNIFNTQGIAFLSECGVTRVCLSPELTLSQIGTLTGKSVLPLECLVHGKMPLMISAYCAAGSFLGDLHKGNCRQVCQQETMFLKDRKNECFELKTDQHCRMHVLNGKVLSLAGNMDRIAGAGVSTARIDARALPIADLAACVTAYRQELLGGENVLDRSGSTRGHFFRGVLAHTE